MRTETEDVGEDVEQRELSGEGAQEGDLSSASDEKILKDALARYDLAESAETEIRINALEDLKFRAGEQWHPKDLSDRRLANRPVVTMNRIPQLVQQITNEQRQNRHSIKVHPVDDKADVKTAEVLQGLIRDIEYQSKADAARDHAFEGAVTGGFGYYRLITDYCDEMSFDLDIRFKRIRNWFSVFFDPSSEEPDGSDANWAFIVDDMSPEDFRAEHPDSKLAKASSIKEALGNAKPIWFKDGYVRVAEYFYREWKRETLYLLSDGSTCLEKDIEAKQAKLLEGYDRLVAQAKAAGQMIPPRPTLRVVKTRKTMVPLVHWLTINGAEILDRTTWLGKWIPVIPVYGNELYIEGRRILEGIVRHAKDPQRMQNYWTTMQTETIALAPKSPFIAAAGQIKGFEQDWREVNTRAIPVLQYNPVDLNGVPVPPPARNNFEPPIMAITQAKLAATDDMKAVTGEYDASVGNRSNETSGIAIQSRDMQAKTANFHFVDNLRRSDLHAARQVLDLIPKIIDTPRARRIIGEDGSQRMVTLNKPYKDEKGQELNYQLQVGKYDVILDTGPTFATRRQESAASMIDAAKVVPRLGEVAADLIVQSMDWTHSQQIAERLRRTMPPGVAEDPGQGQNQVSPEIQQKMAQQGQMVEALTQQLNAAKQALETKQAELDSRERIAAAKNETDKEIAMAKLGSQEAIALLTAQIQAIGKKLDIMGQHQQMEHDQEMARAAAMQPEGFVEQEHDFGAEDAGAEDAPEATPGQPPTGGESPGSSMET